MASFYDQIEANRRNTYLLVFAVFALVFGAVYAFSLIVFDGGMASFLVALCFSAFYIGITYFFADRVVLSMAGAKEADPRENAYYKNTVENIAIAAGMVAPKAFIIEDTGLNAFAVGKPGSSAVAVTTGLLAKLNRAELEGVVAHEVSHIKNYDSRLGALIVVMVGLIALLSELGLRSAFWGRRGSGRGGGGAMVLLIGLAIMVLAPIAAQAVRLAISRQREYLADATGAQLTRYPEGLASALEKIKGNANVARASDATAPLYIANPLSFSGFFSTHPPIDERIRRLRAM
jgi:heat shock protein HtpX